MRPNQEIQRFARLIKKHGGNGGTYQQKMLRTATALGDTNDGLAIKVLAKDGQYKSEQQFLRMVAIPIDHEKNVIEIRDGLLGMRAKCIKEDLDVVKSAYMLQNLLSQYQRIYPDKTVVAGLKAFKDTEADELMRLVNVEFIKTLLDAFTTDKSEEEIRKILNGHLAHIDHRLVVRPYYFESLFETLRKEPYESIEGLEERVRTFVRLDYVITDALVETFGGDVSQEAVIEKSAKWLTYFNKTCDLEAKEYFKKASDRQGELLGAEVKAVKENMDKLNESLTEAQNEIKVLDKSLSEKRERKVKLESQFDAEQDLARWVEKANANKSPLSKNEAVRAHKWLTAIHEDKVFNMQEGESHLPKPFLVAVHKRAQSILVRHNWGEALGESIRAVCKDDAPVSIVLPYDVCFFEFYVEGRCVIVTVIQEDVEIKGDDDRRYRPPEFIVAIECINGYWLQENVKVIAMETTPFLKSLLGQVQGICVALEAKIAVSEVIEADVKLNKKRVANGKPPLMSYHVIDLMDRKARGGTCSEKKEYQGIVRWHLRQGHWRYFKDGKPRIRIGWMAVGNAELGMILKHYVI